MRPARAAAPGTYNLLPNDARGSYLQLALAPVNHRARGVVALAV